MIAEWEEMRLCLTEGRPSHFDEDASYEEHKAAEEICRRCPVAELCLESRSGSDCGVYGGLIFSKHLSRTVDDYHCKPRACAWEECDEIFVPTGRGRQFYHSDACRRAAHLAQDRGRSQRRYARSKVSA